MIFFLNLDEPSAPGRPDITSVDKTDMGLTWALPESDGGSPITGYTIEKKEKTGKWTKAIKTTVTETTTTVTGLIEKKEYQFRVAAINLAGTGPFSEPTDYKMAKAPYGKNYNVHYLYTYLMYIYHQYLHVLA